ncbi:alpha/beta fold hydrolase [Tenacibaculum maritimum]|uniref:alpha/beta fold hydrolase n=1 Tax=Tenacibaculum maritimum TaxID=107401 RepID=UPI0010A48E18|nr:alpha/beta hydrolase [Tenacibaculum maritimum]MCD9582265.1 alpha/beta hydrolase [Tenacibaculum maritimum]MCD9584084.1 alpha/beta hydrolase [Tenacibaculum maritimum]MCD9610958.1 alpha/beta hydrolase [Tenacibaculum maritimum]MCD9619876.1 alpha/beta hydrolase [Tenacibaculum maritimum]MCD9627373.1 alpha/beta hydrolase [Tenacibaculum maritimum]
MQNFIIYKNIKIAFSSEGKGGSIVLLHGFLENSTMWSSVKKELSKRNRVICIDLLGHGKTDCLGYIHTMVDMAKGVAAVLKHLKIRRSILIGHSMGGYVGLAFAECFPDNVKGLCLVNSTAKADLEARKTMRIRAVEAAKREYTTLVKLSITNLFGAENKKLFRREIKEVEKQALSTPLQGYIAAQEGMRLRKDREVLLYFSPYKKMIIVGKEDAMLHHEELLEQTKNPEVEVVILPGGHMSHIENEEGLIAALKKFIRS